MAGEIFISYRRADEPRARLLYNELKSQGVDAWYDAQVGAGEDWRLATANALKNARIFVLLYSRAAAGSDDIAKELAAATLSKKLVVPVRLEDIQPDGAFLYELASRNWVDAFTDTESKLGELAKSLAALVRSGKLDATMLPFDRHAGEAEVREKKKAGAASSRAKMIGLLAGAGVVAAGIAALALAALNPKPETQAMAKGNAQRVAFFGFDAPAGDARLRDLATGITEELFQGLNAERLDAVARTETDGTGPDDRLPHAAELGAAYALGGEVRVDGPSTVATIRLVDVPSRTTLWEETLSARTDGPHAPFLRTRAVMLAASTLKCVTRYRASLVRDDLQAMRIIPIVCRDLVTSMPPNVTLWRDLLARAPDSQLLQAAFAITTQAHRMRLPRATEETLLREFQDKADSIIALDPDSAAATLMRFAVARWRLQPLAGQEENMLEGLRRWPSDGQLNMWYSYFLLGVGRNTEALPYAKAALNDDPLLPAYHIQMGRVQENLGSNALAMDAIGRGMAGAPTQYNWFFWMAYALMAQPEAADTVLALAPESMNPEVVGCWARLIVLAKSTDPAVRSAMPQKFGDCIPLLQEVAPGTMVMIMAALGQSDRLLNRETAPEAIRFGTGHMTPLFMPALRAHRAHPGFARFAEDLGMMAYWRSTKHFPDFCRVEAAPLCAAIGAPPAAGGLFDP